jgi:hypothetical protein
MREVLYLGGMALSAVLIVKASYLGSRYETDENLFLFAGGAIGTYILWKKGMFK